MRLLGAAVNGAAGRDERGRNRKEYTEIILRAWNESVYWKRSKQ